MSARVAAAQLSPQRGLDKSLIRGGEGVPVNSQARDGRLSNVNGGGGRHKLIYPGIPYLSQSPCNQRGTRGHQLGPETNLLDLDCGLAGVKVTDDEKGQSALADWPSELKVRFCLGRCNEHNACGSGANCLEVYLWQGAGL